MLRRFILGGAGGATALADVGLLLMRVLAGLGLAFAHGMRKLPPSDRFVARVDSLGFPLPDVFAWGAGIVEFAGGLLLVLGLLTRPAASLALIVVGTAYFGAHADDSFSDAEAAFLYGAIMLALALMGAGRFSLDAALARRRGGYVDRFRR
jgi:putative oxidoreductase